MNTVRALTFWILTFCPFLAAYGGVYFTLKPIEESWKEYAQEEGKPETPLPELISKLGGWYVIHPQTQECMVVIANTEVPYTPDNVPDEIREKILFLFKRCMMMKNGTSIVVPEQPRDNSI